MPLCTNIRCRKRGIEQPPSVFKGDNGSAVKTCQDCRDRSKGYWKRHYYRETSGKTRQAPPRIRENMEAGEPPKFIFEWERERHREWLRGLHKEVVRG